MYNNQQLNLIKQFYTLYGTEYETEENKSNYIIDIYKNSTNVNVSNSIKRNCIEMRKSMP